MRPSTRRWATSACASGRPSCKPRLTAGSRRRRRRTPRRTRRSGPTGAATRCRTGWPTSKRGWPRFAKPRQNWRPRRKPRRRPQPARAKVDEKPPRNPPPAAAPEPKAQRNFTDPESRILKTKDGYIQGYNAQAAVDAHAQIIVAHTLGNNGSDQNQFAPLLDAIKTNLGSNPDEVSADAGYCSTANLRTLSRRRIKGYIATGRQKHGSKSATAERPAKPGSLLARMTSRLRRAGHRSRYRLRKQVVEPVFGQVK